MSLPPVPDSSYVKHFDGMLWMAYTPKDMKAYGQACRDAALEEAAMAAENGFKYAKDGYQISDAIRSLK
jgi:hypothetical protein